MTSTDLRVNFKFDTGEYPVWVEDLFKEKKIINGIEITPDPATYYGFKFKSIYGLWLEEQMGNATELRDEYLRSTAERAVTFQSRSKFIDGLRSTYTAWLEDKLLERLNDYS